MKKILGIILVSGIIASCGKVLEYSNDFGTAAFINASPFSIPPAGSPTINMLVFIDTAIKTGSNLVYTGSSGYLSVAPGVRKIEVRSSIDQVTKFAEISTESFASNTASTFVIYDTLDAVTGRARLLRLRDTLTLPAAGLIKVRFLPLALNSSAMDVTLLRTSVTPNDSVTLFNQSFVGPTPSAAALATLSGFVSIPAGAYSVKLKTAGTQTVLATQVLSLANLAGTGNITGINTIFTTGNAKGLPLRVGLFRHYP